MGGFKLGKMTFGSLFKKPETTCYPFEKKPAPAGLKGHVENHYEDCILCGICVNKCPCQAIEIDKSERSWSIDGFRCIQCYTCVRSCPKNCLEMLPDYTPVATKMSKTSVIVPDKKKAAKEE